jgi:hypothetical protein
MTKQYIPDISFHLIFCFLTLKELTLIAQCSRYFKRLVTNPFFLNMVSYEDPFDIKNKLVEMIESPFQHTIKNIDCKSISYNTEMLQLFTRFTRLKKLTLQYTPDGNISNPNNLISKTIQDLDIFIYASLCSHHEMKLFLSETFHLFPNLIKLDLGFNYFFYFEAQFDLTNLVQLKHLETLILNDQHGYLSDTNIINVVRSLPELSVFAVHGPNFSLIKNRLENLRLLCAQPGAPRLLKIIDSESLELTDLETCPNEIEHLLNQLPAIEQVNLKIDNNVLIPIQLAKWTKSLQLYGRNFNVDDFKALSYFKKLESFSLYRCLVNRFSFENIINRKLKQLTIMDCIAIPMTFKSISQFNELTDLRLNNCTGLFASEFHFLFNCSKLEIIIIRNSGLILSEHWQAALKIPSSVFPSLRYQAIS